MRVYFLYFNCRKCKLIQIIRFDFLGEKEDEEDPTKYLIFKHSGPELPDPTSFKIKGDTMWISFRSDDWDNYSGFEVHVADTSVFGK